MKLAGQFSSVTDETLAEMVGRLVVALSPRAIYLFGSQLYGVPRRDSDIDIMVIVEDDPVSIEHHKRGYEALYGSGFPVELHIASRRRFERFGDVIGSIHHEIKQKGALIYAAET